MSGRTKVWLVVATIFTIGNFVGAGFAAAASEWPHALLHVVLGVLGGWWMARLLRPRTPAISEMALPDEARLESLQQSVDAIAVEVERIGEAQRYAVKREQERVAGEPPPR